MRHLKIVCVWFCMMAMTCAFPGILHSQVVIQVTYGSGTGNWNSLWPGESAQGLKDFNTGIATEIDHSGTGWVNSIYSSGWSGGDKDWVEEDRVGTTSGPEADSGTVTFNGLTGNPWTVEVVSSVYFGNVVDIKVKSSFADRNYDAIPDKLGDDWNCNTDGADNWLIWDNVIPSAGSITISLDQVSGTYGGLSAIRLVGPSEGAEETILSFTAVSSYSISANDLYYFSFQIPGSTNYDLSALGTEIDSGSAAGAMKFGLYDSSQQLLWGSGEIAVTGGINEDVSASISANTVTLEAGNSYYIAFMSGTSLRLKTADYSEENQGTATIPGHATRVDSDITYPTFPDPAEYDIFHLPLRTTNTPDTE